MPFSIVGPERTYIFLQVLGGKSDALQAHLAQQGIVTEIYYLLPFTALRSPFTIQERSRACLGIKRPKVFFDQIGLGREIGCKCNAAGLVERDDPTLATLGTQKLYAGLSWWLIAKRSSFVGPRPGASYGWAVDVIVVTSKDTRRYKDAPSLVIKPALHKGIVAYKHAVQMILTSS